MKKLMTIMVMLMFVVSLAPAFAQDTDDEIDATNMDRCLAHMEDRVRDAESVCERVVNHVDRCVATLEERGIDAPVRACEAMRLKVATAVQTRVDTRIRDRVDDRDIEIRERVRDDEIEIRERIRDGDGNEIRTELRDRISDHREDIRLKMATNLRDRVADHRVDRVARLTDEHPRIADWISDLPEDRQKVFLHLPRARQAEILHMGPADASHEIAKYRVEIRSKDELFKHRTVAKERVERARENYDEAKDRLEEVKDRLRDARADFEAARDSGDDASAMEHAKNYLLRTADHVITALEKIQHRVEESEDLSEEEAQEILDEIAAKIAEMEEAKELVEAAQTKEEVKEAGKVILEAWREIKVRFEIHVAKLRWAQVGTIIERSAHLENRFDCALSSLEAQGIDVSDIEENIEEFSALVESAHDNHAAARDAFVAAKELRASDDADRDAIKDLLKEARDLMKGAQDNLKDAHRLLKDVQKDIREAGGDLSGCNDSDAGVADDEEVVIVEDDDDADDGEGDEIDDGEGDLDEVEDEEEEIDEEELSLEPVEPSELDRRACWADKPDYTPGQDKGYFLWQGECANTVWLDWSGDTADEWKRFRACVSERLDRDLDEDASIDVITDVLVDVDADIASVDASLSTAVSVNTDEETFCEGLTRDEFKRIRDHLLYPVRGKIVTNGAFVDVGVHKFDGMDVFRHDEDTIVFKGLVGPHFDRLYFRTSGDVVGFDLIFDGERDTELIHVGPHSRHPAHDPFRLHVDPAVRPPACDDGQVIQDGVCVDDGSIVTDDGSAGDSDFEIDAVTDISASAEIEA